VTVGKLFTHVSLSPSSIIWYQPVTGRAVMPYDWEGNCRSGDPLAMHHVLHWFFKLQATAMEMNTHLHTSVA